MAFRYDIGVLRAIAVLAVLLYHYKIPYFEGGFVGVDIFFVISGYLMTNIIVNDLNKKKFNYFNFIKRRATRILPALLLVSIFIIIISHLLFFDQQIQLNAKYVLHSVLFTSNIFYWLSQNYFDAGAQYNIFIHSWSLSVEWQFYMLYPFLLLLLNRFFQLQSRGFKAAYITLVCLSFFLCLYAAENYRTFNFYMLPTRAWEMMLGGAIVFFNKPFQAFNSKLRTFLFYCSLATLLLTIWGYDEKIVWPSIYTIVPCLATFFIIALNPQQSWIKNKHIQFLGDNSYSIYLWHWPLFVIVNSFGLTHSLYIVLAFCLSFCLAFLSYHYFEKNKKISTLKITGTLVVLTISLSVFSIMGSNQPVFSKIRILPEAIRPYFEYDQLPQFNSCKCFVTRGVRYQHYDHNSCLSIKPNKEHILLLGDSHAAQYSASFRKILDQDQHLLELSAGFTFPFLNPKGDQQSVDLVKSLYTNFIPQYANKISKVFISVHWLMKNDLQYSDQEIELKLMELLAYLNKYKLDYYFIGQTEEYQIGFNRIMLGKYIHQKINPSNFMRADAQLINEWLKTKIPPGRYIDIYNLPSIQKVDPETKLPYMFDSNHLTEYGADQVIKYIHKLGYLQTKPKN